MEKIRTQFLSPVTTSPHGDKVVSIGDIVMLKNLHLSHSVAIFSDNQIHFSVTGEKTSKMNGLGLKWTILGVERLKVDGINLDEPND